MLFYKKKASGKCILDSYEPLVFSESKNKKIKKQHNQCSSIPKLFSESKYTVHWVQHCLIAK